MYTADNWIDKNRGYVQPDLAFLMSTSTAPLIEKLFPFQAKSEDKKASTVLASFRASLRALNATLLQTTARYIRCIKPNSNKVRSRDACLHACRPRALTCALHSMHQPQLEPGARRV